MIPAPKGHTWNMSGTLQPQHLLQQAQCSLPGARPAAGRQARGATDGVHLEGRPGEVEPGMMDSLGCFIGT